MTNVSTGALKGRYMQEVYEVVCRHPKGVIASDVKRECPTIPSGRVGATLRKLKDLGLVRAEYDNTSTVIRRWFRVRGEMSEMRALTVCCADMRRDVLCHNVRMDYAEGRVMNTHGEEMWKCPYCKKEFEWKVM